jgi:hypothetical protein
MASDHRGSLVTPHKSIVNISKTIRAIAVLNAGVRPASQLAGIDKAMHASISWIRDEVEDGVNILYLTGVWRLSNLGRPGEARGHSCWDDAPRQACRPPHDLTRATT